MENNPAEIKGHSAVNRSQIARTIFSAAESMGISDRERIEAIIDQVIARTEPRSLPGMENFVPEPKNKARYVPTVSEIQKHGEGYTGERKKKQEMPKESQPKMQTTMAKPPVNSPTASA